MKSGRPPAPTTTVGASEVDVFEDPCQVALEPAERVAILAYCLLPPDACKSMSSITMRYCTYLA